ncbi:hybrid sensor histidine kinase/response regulator transcription factor [Xanthocytophaga agilis]|uniref:histidine kinase n=1 Tax=Xanthocytophaga agilis TaxID=3048010 RepID=A0AAE3UH34_9BACT|nr:two-component regulator propeller domain-containing protein [Xanthocytophaga agilis]MDJ1505618.1 two-component regulator propeller domain-containing protein [Xanthocytophaga agilis]
MVGRFCIGVAIFCIGLQSVCAQFHPKNLIRHWTSKNGLSQGVVNSVTQDQQSRMWFATEDGLNQFDGYSFRVFRYNPDSKISIADNFIQSLFTDSEGTLWISSRKGLLQFDATHETFLHYQYDFGNYQQHAYNDVSFITEGSAHNLWIAWYGGGFASFNKKSKKFTPYIPETYPDLQNTKTISLWEDKFGLLWVGTQQGGLEVFQVSGGQVIKKISSLSIPKFQSANVYCFEEDKAGNIWIGTSVGLAIYKRLENKFFFFDSPETSIASIPVNSLLIDSGENLWIGTLAAGIYQLDLRQLQTRSLEECKFISMKTIGSSDISKRTIQSIYEDKDKNIWIGTYGDGAYLVSSSKENFVRVEKNMYTSSTASKVPFYGMCYDPEGNLWLGTDGDGIYKTDLYGRTLKHFIAGKGPGKLTDNAILAALWDAQGRLWLGSYAHGVFLYNPANDSFVNYQYLTEDPLKQGGNDVRIIFQDSRNRIWIGTNRGGLCLLDEKNKTYSNLPYFRGALREGDVRSITEDQQGNLWIGFYGDGVYSYNPVTRLYNRYFTDSPEREQIKSDIVFAIKSDRSGRIWMGTGGSGLCVFDPQHNTLRRYSEKNGLANNTIYSILCDKDENIWVSTNLGISKFDRSQHVFFNYDISDGLQEGQFNPGSALYNQVGGYMCMGGSQGMNMFYPDQVKESTQCSRILITGISLFNKPVHIRDTLDGNPILQKAISQTKHITLEHDQNLLTFEFAGVNYNYPEKNKYSYMLEGLDKEWNFVGNARTATYRYLKPGDYVFKVKVFANANIRNEDFTSISVTVKPAFWQSPLAYLFYVLLLIAVGWIVFSVIRREIKLKKRLTVERKQRRYERRLVQQKLTFFTEVSHEFKTPLTLMLGPLEEMLAEEPQSSQTGRKLQMMHRNAHKLLDLINKLLDYRKLENGKVVLKVKPDNLVSFVEDIAATFRPLAQHRNILFQVDSEQPFILAWFDKEKLEMALNNLISNAFKYIGKGNHIIVGISVQTNEKYPEDCALISIKDDGIGIPKKYQQAIFDWFHQGESSGSMSSGIGLSLAKKLVHLHNGEIDVESQEGAGSTFSITIPLGNEHFRPEEIAVPDVSEGQTYFDDTLYRQDSIQDSLKPHWQNPLWQASFYSDSELPGKKKGFPSLLLIEDDEEIRLFLREFFEKEYRIFEAPNGKEGYNLALSCHPDLIISDIMMPEMSGIQLCRKLKENIRTSHIPVILLTARSGISSHKEGMEIGADAYLTKPFSTDILRLTVHNLLDSQQRLMRFYRNYFASEGSQTERSAKNEGINPLDEKFLNSINEMLKSNLDNPEFTIEELSDVLNMSRSLVYKKVKMLTGLSPNEYVRSFRLAEAARLLKSRQYKVFEVVYMVGFTDLKYFRQCFAKEFGCSPSEFIKQE